MARVKCQVCRNHVYPDNMEEHHIIPTSLTEELGISESQTVRLCASCHKDVHAWYTARIRHTEYDADARLFRQKSPPEMINEYQTAFNAFIHYRLSQPRT